MLSSHRHGPWPPPPPQTPTSLPPPPPPPPVPQLRPSALTPVAASHVTSPDDSDPCALAPDDAIAALSSLADSAGSAAALALFHRLASSHDLLRLMRLYITAATTFVARGSLPMAHEVMRRMVAAFAEAGRLPEVADVVFEMRSHGLPLCTETANWVLIVGLESGNFAYARKVFDGTVTHAASGCCNH